MFLGGYGIQPQADAKATGRLRRRLALTMGRDGYRVLEAPDGVAALAVARERKPELVLLDVHLPDLDGFEVCRRIKSMNLLGPGAISTMSSSRRIWCMGAPPGEPS